MGIIVKSKVFPLRASIRAKESFELQVEIESEDNESKKVSMNISLPEGLTFTKPGENRLMEKKFDEFKPRQRVSFKQPIFFAPSAETGNLSGEVIVQEHFRDYGYVTKKYKSEFSMRVVE